MSEACQSAGCLTNGLTAVEEISVLGTWGFSEIADHQLNERESQGSEAQRWMVQLIQDSRDS